MSVCLSGPEQMCVPMLLQKTTILLHQDENVPPSTSVLRIMIG